MAIWAYYTVRVQPVGDKCNAPPCKPPRTVFFRVPAVGGEFSCAATRVCIRVLGVLEYHGIVNIAIEGASCACRVLTALLLLYFGVFWCILAVLHS